MDVNALVRTSQGDKKLGDVHVGDFLIGADGAQVVCLEAFPPEHGPMKEVRYLQFGSSTKEASVVCAENHRILFVISAQKPSAHRRGVAWDTHCDRSELAQDAAELSEPVDVSSLSLYIDELASELSQDILVEDLTQDKDEPTMDKNDPAVVLAWIKEVIDVHIQYGGHEEYGTEINKILSELGFDIEEVTYVVTGDAESDFVAWAAYLTDILNDRVAALLALEADDSSDDVQEEAQGSSSSDMEVEDDMFAFDIGPVSDEFMSQVRSSQSHSQRTNHTSQHTSQSYEPSTQSSGYSGQSIPQDLKNRLASIMESIQGCPCKTMRTLSRKFEDADQAKLVARILNSDYYHLIDPCVVHPGDELLVTADQTQRACQPTTRLRRFKLLRGAPPPTPVLYQHSDLPIDPYFLGFWLTDGFKDSPAVASTDPEIKAYVFELVASLNSTRPPGTRPLKVTATLMQAAGQVCREGLRPIIATKDCWSLAIVSDQSVPSEHWNPIRTGLQHFGLLGTKAAGIPDIYKHADENSKLALIAGMIDGDGWFDKHTRLYGMAQCGEEHLKMVHDYKDVLQSCGIPTSPVATYEKSNIMGDKVQSWTEYRTYFAFGEKLQARFLIPRKKWGDNFSTYHNDANIRKIQKVSDVDGGGFSRRIRVAGGRYQLDDGLVVACEF
jgi:hypothetical protein